MTSDAVQLIQAYEQDHDRILPLLKTFWKADTPQRRQSTQRLFTSKWEDRQGMRGWMLLADDNVVGYLGTVYHKRMIQGQEREFCNLTSWYVLEEYRRNSLRLARSALREKDVTYTALTATDRAAQIWQKLGFTVLEDAERIIYPQLHACFGKCRVERVTESNCQRMSPEDLQIYQQHQHLPCEHVLVDEGNGYCYLIVRRVPRKPIAFARVFHISNPTFLKRVINQAVTKMCMLLRIGAVRFENRYFDDQSILFSRRRPFPQPRLFRSADLSALDVDGLYSELLIL